MVLVLFSEVDTVSGCVLFCCVVMGNGKEGGSMEAQALKKQINLLDLAKSMGIKQNGPLFHCFNSKEHRNGDKNPSLSIQPGYFKCFGCGIAGDVYAFFQAIEGTDFLESKKRVLALLGNDIPIPKMTYTGHSEKMPPVVTQPFLGLMKDIWAIVEPLPLTVQAESYLLSRGIHEPKIAHELGFRDFSPQKNEINAILKRYDLKEMGFEREGKLCPSFRILDGLKIPLFCPSKTFPVGWRTRLYQPWKSIKELGSYRQDLTPFPVGYKDPEAEILIIAEGTPDYLSFYQAWTHLWDKVERIHFDVWGVVSLSSGWKSSWNSVLQKYKHVLVASHDTKQSHIFAGQIAEALKNIHGERASSVFTRKLLAESNDANDLLKQGKLDRWVLDALKGGYRG